MVPRFEGRYDVYYDKEKTKIMARIGYLVNTPNGVLERYDLNGNKVYECVLSNGVLNGALKVFKGSNLFINYTYDMGVITNATIHGGYQYIVSYLNGVLHGELSIKKGGLNVFIGDLENSKFKTLNVYDELGDIDTHIPLVHGKYHGWAKYKKTVELFYKDDIINGSESLVKSMYWNRDMHLTFANSNMYLAGEIYTKLK